jgi:2-polyprenyl-3-methyl-5-hydroxy-6-metoxy-1,4-benzoquinol methylase
MEVKTYQIVSTIKNKFFAEGLTRFFTIRSYNFSTSGGNLALDNENCILLEFPTPYEDFPDSYQSPTYRLLIIFSLHQETEFAPPLQTSLRKLQDKDNIDRIILWSTVTVDQYILENLKTINIDLIFVHIPPLDEVRKARTVTYFVPIEGGDLDYSLRINWIAEKLIKRLKKMFHLVLSEVSAAIYDQHYGKTKIATHAAMEFEERQLTKLLKRFQKAKTPRDLAIDIGCGTGRHSFPLARFFDEVYAYDFSPRMIKEANDRKRRDDITNIIFSVNDFEYEKFLEENDLCGMCDLIVASFGMGSYIEETPEMLRRFYNWLKPDGYVFLSFYNANSITLNVTPNWRDVSLTAQVDKENQSLEVSLTPKTRFNIFCKLFDEGTRGEINKIFDIDEIVTYPTIMALLPNSLMESELARDFFERVDEVIARDHESHFAQLGYYVTVIAQKVDRITNSYLNLQQILHQHGAEYELLDHAPVLSVEDVRREIGNWPGCIIKTIIFKNVKTDQFIAVSVPAEKQVDKAKIAQEFGIGSNKIKFATEKEVLKLGFPVGGVAPFGFEQNDEVQIISYLDAAIAQQSCDWFYTGAGDNRKTLKIRPRDFLAITTGYRRLQF